MSRVLLACLVMLLAPTAHADHPTYDIQQPHPYHEHVLACTKADQVPCTVRLSDCYVDHIKGAYWRENLAAVLDHPVWASPVGALSELFYDGAEDPWLLSHARIWPGTGHCPSGADMHRGAS